MKTYKDLFVDPLAPKNKAKTSHSATVSGRKAAYPFTRSAMLPMSNAPGSITGGQVLKLLDLGMSAQTLGVEKLGNLSAKQAHDAIQTHLGSKKNTIAF